MEEARTAVELGRLDGCQLYFPEHHRLDRESPAQSMPKPFEYLIAFSSLSFNFSLFL